MRMHDCGIFGYRGLTGKKQKKKALIIIYVNWAINTVGCLSAFGLKTKVDLIIS